MMNKNRLIPKLIIIVPISLVLVLSFFMGTFYIEKIESYFDQARKNSIDEYITNKKKESEIWVNQLNILLKYKSDSIDEFIKNELKTRVDLAYDSAKYIYEKYKNTKSKNDIKIRIKDALSKMNFNEKKNHIFITSFNGQSILSGSREFQGKNILDYSDADGRAIVLEEITKVRKRKEGFIKSRQYSADGIKTIYVKDLGFYDWYIGSSIFDIQQIELAKHNSLDIVRSTPVFPNDLMAIYDNKSSIYLSSRIRDILGDDSLKTIKNTLTKKSQWHKIDVDGYLYYSKYFKEFDWYIVYGFNISQMSKSELKKQESLQQVLDNELEFLTKISALIVILVLILSMIFSRTVNRMFLSYQKEVKSRQGQLELLNASLEQKVARELYNLRQKDKMLIQQSKMADMGDMLSLIAHQWRQPLNQLSYIFMNIDSAYEYKELNKKYLDGKIKEGNHLLEFMSQTIDDFRDYFKPNQKRELINISDIVKRAIELMKKPLEDSNIEIVHTNRCNKEIELYVNEFVQVILSLIKNAKDVLIHNSIKNPKIEIVTSCDEDGVVVEVKDNGGGIEVYILDQIFEPYFTTKDKQHGTGLGLYMSKMIVEEHLGGKITVENIDKGACFKIFL